MKKLILIIMDQEVGPRMNASLANQNRGPQRWSAVWGNVLRSSVGMNKHCRNKGQRGVLKISKEKAATTALNALQLTL